MNTFDATDLLKELDAGLLASKLTAIVKETALAVAEHGKKGQVSVTLDMARIGETMQVSLSHKLAYKRPTKKGVAQGHDTDIVPVYVNGKGEVSILPHNQLNIFSTEDTEETK